MSLFFSRKTQGRTGTLTAVGRRTRDARGKWRQRRTGADSGATEIPLPLPMRDTAATGGVLERALERVPEVADLLDHVGDVGQGRVGGGEGRHVLAAVPGEAERVEAGDDEALGCRDEAEDADHREAAVVDLGEQRLLLALGRHVLGEAEGVPEVEGDL